MVAKPSSSDVNAPNSGRGLISDDDLIRGFIMALGAGGRKSRTLFIYEDSIRSLSDFARNLGLPSLATMDRTHILSRALGKCTRGAEQNCTTERRSMSMEVSWSAEAWF
jgi:hypothetical protein